MKELFSDLKVLFEDQKQASKNVQMGEDAHRKVNNDLNETLKRKKLILKNGTLEPQRDPVSNMTISGVDTATLIEHAQQSMKKKNPLDPIINKFAEQGYDAEAAFEMLDDNGDEVLTMEEIKEGMKFHRITLTDDEWAEFIKAIDGNSDGVLTMEEWMAIMAP